MSSTEEPRHAETAHTPHQRDRKRPRVSEEVPAGIRSDVVGAPAPVPWEPTGAPLGASRAQAASQLSAPEGFRELTGCIRLGGLFIDRAALRQKPRPRALRAGGVPAAPRGWSRHSDGAKVSSPTFGEKEPSSDKNRLQTTQNSTLIYIRMALIHTFITAFGVVTSCLDRVTPLRMEVRVATEPGSAGLEVVSFSGE